MPYQITYRQNCDFPGCPSHAVMVSDGTTPAAKLWSYGWKRLGNGQWICSDNHELPRVEKEKS